MNARLTNLTTGKTIELADVKVNTVREPTACPDPFVPFMSTRTYELTFEKVSPTLWRLLTGQQFPSAVWRRATRIRRARQRR